MKTELSTLERRVSKAIGYQKVTVTEVVKAAYKKVKVADRPYPTVQRNNVLVAINRINKKWTASNSPYRIVSDKKVGRTGKQVWLEVK